MMRIFVALRSSFCYLALSTLGGVSLLLGLWCVYAVCVGLSPFFLLGIGWQGWAGRMASVSRPLPPSLCLPACVYHSPSPTVHKGSEQSVSHEGLALSGRRPADGDLAVGGMRCFFMGWCCGVRGT